MANVQISTKRQSLMLSDLRDIGVIRSSKKVDNVNINVLCLDDDGDPVMQVTDFRNLGNQYLMYHGHQYIECASCGLVVPKKKQLATLLQALRGGTQSAKIEGEILGKVQNIAGIMTAICRQNWFRFSRHFD